MGGDEKGVLALCPAHGRLVAHAVGLLGADLPRLERLPYLIAQHVRVPLLLPARDGLVFRLAQKELRIGGHMIALIGGNELPALGFFGILPVVETAFHRLRDGFALADMVGL